MTKYKLTFVTSDDNGNFDYYQNKIVIVDSQGIITAIDDANHETDVIDYSAYLTIPSFSDLHLHAAQLNVAGIGYDLPILDWFSEVIYPAEELYDNPEYYLKINKNLINQLWQYGIFNTAVFAALGLEATLNLMDVFAKSGLNAYVGKMNADLNQKESLETSLKATEAAINYSEKLSKNVRYAITPEFIPTCSFELMAGLGRLAKEHDLLVQTHFAEGSFDYKIVKEQYPGLDYVEVYHKAGLLRPHKTLLAHGISATKQDLALIKANQAILVHCPTALSDNPSDDNILIKPLLEAGIMVGYGSDIGGSGTLNPWQNAIAMTRYANVLNVAKQNNEILIWDSLDIMMRQNGRIFGNYGKIDVGQKFSALVIDDRKQQTEFPLDNKNRLLRFVYQAESEQIAFRYHDGKELKKPF